MHRCGNCGGWQKHSPQTRCLRHISGSVILSRLLKRHPLMFQLNRRQQRRRKMLQRRLSFFGYVVSYPTHMALAAEISHPNGKRLFGEELHIPVSSQWIPVSPLFCQLFFHHSLQLHPLWNETDLKISPTSNSESNNSLLELFLWRTINILVGKGQRESVSKSADLQLSRGALGGACSRAHLSPFI